MFCFTDAKVPTAIANIAYPQNDSFEALTHMVLGKIYLAKTKIYERSRVLRIQLQKF